MCWRPGCLFRNRRVSDDSSDEVINCLVIGASGMVGSAVIEAALTCGWLKISAFTRDAKNLRCMPEVMDGSVRVIEGDMLQVKTLQKAMQDMDAVFFTTNYWDKMSDQNEFNQGVNVVEAAVKLQLKHLIYVGTPYCNEQASVECPYLRGREKVEKLILDCGVPYTIFHLGFYYENLMSVFRPQRVEPYTYAVALPMGNVALNVGSLHDFAVCIAKSMVQSANFKGLTIKLATGYHTVTQIAAWLDRHFKDLTFFDPKIELDEYASLDFEGSDALSTMFSFLASYPGNVRWNTQEIYQICPWAKNFKDWLFENDKGFRYCLQVDQPEIEHPSTVHGISSTDNLIGLTGNQIRVKIKTDFVSKEVEQSFHRRARTLNDFSLLRAFRDLWEVFIQADG